MLKEKLEHLKSKFIEVEKTVADPALVKDVKRYKDVMREHAYLSDLMAEYDNYLACENQIADAKALIHDEADVEMREMAKAELHELEAALDASENKLKLLLIPPDPLEEKNIIMEIRGGTGGEEAAVRCRLVQNVHALCGNERLEMRGDVAQRNGAWRFQGNYFFDFWQICVRELEI